MMSETKPVRLVPREALTTFCAAMGLDATEVVKVTFDAYMATVSVFERDEDGEKIMVETPSSGDWKTYEIIVLVTG